MARYTRPGQHIEEIDSGVRPIQGVGGSIPGFMGICEKGPIKPVYLESIKEFQRIFGVSVEGEPLFESVRGFFLNGGKGCYVLRAAKYSNPASAATLVGAAARYAAASVAQASYATFTGNVDVSTFVVQNNWVMKLNVNGLGMQTYTVAVAAAVLDGAAGAFVQDPGNPGFTYATTTIEYQINSDGIWRSLDLSGLAITPGSNTEVLTYLAAQMEGVKITNNGGQVRITTDREGNSADIQFQNATANWVLSSFGFGDASTAAGTGDFANADLATFAELKTAAELVFQIAAPGDAVVLTQDSSGFLVLTGTAGVAGPTSTLDLDDVGGGATAAFIAAIGLTGMGTYDGGLHEIGAALASVTAGTFYAGYRGYESIGLWGNDIMVQVTDNPMHVSVDPLGGSDLASAATAADTSLLLTTSKGINPGSILRLDDLVAGLYEYVKVGSVETVSSGTGIAHTINLTAGLTNSYALADSTVVSVEHDIVVYDEETEAELERHTQLSMNPDVDNYVGTVINDEDTGSEFLFFVDEDNALPTNLLANMAASQSLASGTTELDGASLALSILGDSDAKTGLYGFDEATDMALLCIPPSADNVQVPANAIVHGAMLAYCETRMDLFAILDAPPGLSKTGAVAYRQNTLGVDTRWGALYFPGIKVADSFGTGKNPTIVIPPSGLMAGIYARVEGIAKPDGGISATPAGEGEYGKVKGAIATEIAISDADAGDLNEAGVNAIRAFKVRGTRRSDILVYGGRTLSTSMEWRYISTRRTITYIEQSALLGTRWAVFKKNYQGTWDSIERILKAFLTTMWKEGQLRGDTAADAFFVKCDSEVNTTTEIDAGIMVIEIGAATQKPAEFVVFRVSQIPGASGVTE